MMDIDTAQGLLVSSYRICARRVRYGIQGHISVATTLGKEPPPNSHGAIVGLCGQGGRHAYFRIPLPVIEATLDRIDNVPPRPAARGMEEVVSACRDLRQQSYFDCR